ncbi:hypothetical protein [Kistimonas asteriae]|uniref:hypothetical protein n=1 Tax=Kistimonas asteriae TaxID=517724 RepID=UPI001BA6A7C7|nr:hypothetical protein [Kistimonas asteriae]
MAKVNGVGSLKALYSNAKESVSPKSLLKALNRKISQITHPTKQPVLSLSTDKTPPTPDKTLPTRTVSHHTPNNTTLSRPPGNPANPASAQKQAVYQNYERASQQLTDLNSIQRFKKDLLMGYGAGNLNDAQFSQLSGKVTSALFRLVRQGQVANLSLTLLTPLVGDDKAREIMKDVDTQLTTRLNTLRCGAAQHPNTLYENLSNKGKQLSTLRDAIAFKRELLARTGSKELSSDKFQKLHINALIPALKKLAQKPEQAKQMTYKRLSLLVGGFQATEILKICRSTLLKADMQLLKSLKNIPDPPTHTPPAA